jgi:hypothetical protein
MNNNNYIQETETVQQNKNKIEDHMLLSQQDRQSHINLTTDCQFHTYTKDRGSKQTGDLYSHREQMREAKRRLLDFHNIEDFGGYNTHLCHKCNCNSHTDKVCVSPLHTYFGTASENELDKPSEVRQKGGKSQGKSHYKNGTGLFGMSEQEQKDAKTKGGNSPTSAFQQKIECPHCFKKSNIANIKQWHGDNCKLKP